MSFKTAYTSLTLVGVLLGTSCRPKPQVEITEEDEFLKAGIALTREDPGAAIHCLTRVIQSNPGLAVAYQHRATALMNAGNYEVAEADVKSAIALNGETTATLQVRAEIERRTGRTDAAIVTLGQIIEAAPKNAFYFSERAALKEVQGDLEGASDDYTRAMELDNERANGTSYHLRRAWIREKLGDLDGALADYNVSIKHPVRNAFYMGKPAFRRGGIYYRRHAFKEALDDFRSAAENCRDRPNSSSRLHIWLVQSRMGEREQANEDLSVLLRNEDAGEYLAGHDRRLIEFLLGRIKESEFLERSEVNRQADSEEDGRIVARAWFYAGMKRLLDGDNHGAVKWFRKAVAIAPKKYPLEECQWAESELKHLNF